MKNLVKYINSSQDRESFTRSLHSLGQEGTHVWRERDSLAQKLKHKNQRTREMKSHRITNGSHFMLISSPFTIFTKKMTEPHNFSESQGTDSKFKKEKERKRRKEKVVEGRGSIVTSQEKSNNKMHLFIQIAREQPHLSPAITLQQQRLGVRFP